MAKRDGIFRKFEVHRTDGTDQKPGDKHFNCVYFVLDVSHDKYAYKALLAYADECEADLPELASDLRSLASVNGLETGRIERSAGSKFPPPCYAPIVKLAMESSLNGPLFPYPAPGKPCPNCGGNTDPADGACQVCG